MSTTPPFNLRKFSQRQEGSPIAFQTVRPDPYEENRPGDGKGYKRNTPGSVPSILSPGDGSGGSFSNGSNLGDISSVENASEHKPFNSTNDNRDTRTIGDSPVGVSRNTDTLLSPNTNDVSQPSGDSPRSPTDEPLSGASNAQRQMSSDRDRKFPLSNPQQVKEQPSLMGRRIIPPIYNEARMNISSNVFKLVKKNVR